ncbi:MAG: copper chaperone PCu(A)C [Rhizobiaceae bacterium]|nr:copper chaperone PCu(A)C [Rhizobiaceae bacterium]
MKAQTFGDLIISKSWILAPPRAAKVAGGFLVITNNGLQDETLTAVQFDGAKKADIHAMKIEGGVMKMRPLKDGITIPAGNSVKLKPGATHLMLMGLSVPIEDGKSFPLKLTFANVGEITVEFPALSRAKGKLLMKDGN